MTMPDSSQSAKTIERFVTLFSADPKVLARAPGRVNLIGEHTDYSDGFVLPFAIDRGVEAAAGPAAGSQIKVHSIDFDETVEFDCRVNKPAAGQHWQNYVRGAVAALRRADVEVPPANLVIGGDLPTGAGLSSSAALCVAVAKALLGVAGRDLDGVTIARAAQTAEHEFAGMPCGIMDQYVSVFGRQDHALLVDCRTLTHEYVPVQLEGFELLVIPSGVKHELVEGAYGRRVQECAEAVACFREANPAVRALRDVTPEMLAQAGNSLPAVAARRARHVVSENDRVQRAVTMLADGRIEEFGELLFTTQDSLRDDYEVSCPEIDQIIAVLRKDADVVGARMIGGGFGGSILAIVKRGALPGLKERLAQPDQPFQLAAEEIVEVRPADGAWCRSL